jgi:acyl carrier protein
MNDLFSEIQKIIADIMDTEDNIDISPDTYLVRDLGAESIDLLEMSVALNNLLNLEIIDEDIFLRRLRDYIIEAEQQHILPENYLLQKFPFLSRERVTEILWDLSSGPVLKIKDVIAYVKWQQHHDA